jgi:hypothetical protein
LDFGTHRGWLILRDLSGGELERGMAGMRHGQQDTVLPCIRALTLEK